MCKKHSQLKFKNKDKKQYKSFSNHNQTILIIIKNIFNYDFLINITNYSYSTEKKNISALWWQGQFRIWFKSYYRNRCDERLSAFVIRWYWWIINLTAKIVLSELQKWWIHIAYHILVTPKKIFKICYWTIRQSWSVYLVTQKQSFIQKFDIGKTTKH